MTVDDVYKLIIEHLVQGYPINIELWDLPYYRANGDIRDGDIRIRTRMIIRILGIDLAQISWDDDEYGPVNGWDNLEKFEKYVS